jgi:hypothetical protein
VKFDEEEKDGRERENREDDKWAPYMTILRVSK